MGTTMWQCHSLSDMLSSADMYQRMLPPLLLVVAMNGIGDDEDGRW
jgi:hypothetical protein